MDVQADLHLRPNITTRFVILSEYPVYDFGIPPNQNCGIVNLDLWFYKLPVIFISQTTRQYCKLLNYLLGEMANVFLLLKIMFLLKNAIKWIITNNVTWNKAAQDQNVHIFAVEGSHRHNLDHTAQSWHYDHWIKQTLTHYKTKISYSGECLTDWMKNRYCKIRKGS